MNTLITRYTLQQPRLLYQVRNVGGYWNKDWQPGKLPTNEKERLEAAKKYNLLPHEYETYTDADTPIVPGDYPKLPDVSVENKDVYYPWDLPDERRNFGEPMHANAIYYQEDRVDTHMVKKLKYSPLVMFLCLSGAVGFITSLKLGDSFRFHPAVAARQIPKEGTVHYTYDPVN